MNIVTATRELETANKRHALYKWLLLIKQSQDDKRELNKKLKKSSKLQQAAYARYSGMAKKKARFARAD